jgi:hypothetical protein
VLVGDAAEIVAGVAGVAGMPHDALVAAFMARNLNSGRVFPY